MERQVEYFYQYDSPMGRLEAASDGEAITGLSFPTQRDLKPRDKQAEWNESLPVFLDLKAWLAAYFDRRDPGSVPLLRPEGTGFRHSVWNILLEIPYGRLITYGEISRRLAHVQGIARMSARAVGGAVGHNPISILIPCHRVIGSDGSLVGYGGGIDLKIKLLAYEGIDKDWK